MIKKYVLAEFIRSLHALGTTNVFGLFWPTLDDEDHDPFAKPGVIIEEEEVEGDTKWTDLPLLKHGSLTGLEIEEEERGIWIRAR